MKSHNIPDQKSITTFEKYGCRYGISGWWCLHTCRKNFTSTDTVNSERIPQILYSTYITTIPRWPCAHAFSRCTLSGQKCGSVCNPLLTTSKKHPWLWLKYSGSALDILNLHSLYIEIYSQSPQLPCLTSTLPLFGMSRLGWPAMFPVLNPASFPRTIWF